MDPRLELLNFEITFESLHMFQTFSYSHQLCKQFNDNKNNIFFSSGGKIGTSVHFKTVLRVYARHLMAFEM